MNYILSINLFMYSDTIIQNKLYLMTYSAFLDNNVTDSQNV